MNMCVFERIQEWVQTNRTGTTLSRAATYHSSHWEKKEIQLLLGLFQHSEWSRKWRHFCLYHPVFQVGFWAKLSSFSTGLYAKVNSWSNPFGIRVHFLFYIAMSKHFLASEVNVEPVIQRKVIRRRKTNLYINIYVWNLEKWYWWTYLQGRNADMRMYLWTQGRKESVGQIDRGTLSYIYTIICKIDG